MAFLTVRFECGKPFNKCSFLQVAVALAAFTTLTSCEHHWGHKVADGHLGSNAYLHDHSKQRHNGWSESNHLVGHDHGYAEKLQSSHGLNNGWNPHRHFGYNVKIHHPSVHGGLGSWGWGAPSQGWTGIYDTQGAGHYGWYKK